MRKAFTRTLTTALLLFAPTFASAQQPVDRREFNRQLSCGVTIGGTRDKYCDGTVIGNLYFARPPILNGQFKEGLRNAACQVYQSGKKVVVATGALIGAAAKATTCAAGKTIEGVGTVEHYIGGKTQRAGQLIQGAGCDAGCYDRTNLDYKCP